MYTIQIEYGNELQGQEFEEVEIICKTKNITSPLSGKENCTEILKSSS